MRILLSVQKRLRDGKIGNIARREFFADSAALHGLDCEAREVPVPAWAYDVSRYSEPPAGKKTKRSQPPG
jgi:hypothetical protein